MLRLRIRDAMRRTKVRKMNSRAQLFFNSIELESSKVMFPEDVVFLCGGEVNHSTSTITSLRDFIYGNEKELFENKKVILAEKAASEFDSRVYDDLLQFEKYIASISRLVMLVSESPGSIAELGAFSQISEIQSKLLVFIHSKHYGENSFIKDGPVRFLENQNEQSVHEFEWQTNKQGNVLKDSAINLVTPMKEAMHFFLEHRPKTEKFDRTKIGHSILLVGGVIAMLRCCKIREITAALDSIGMQISERQIKRIIFCLRLFGWIKSIKRETRYHVYIANSMPFLFKTRNRSQYFDMARTRYEILNAYDSNDPRNSIIKTAVK